jgi:hypothetical protein
MGYLRSKGKKGTLQRLFVKWKKRYRTVVKSNKSSQVVDVIKRFILASEEGSSGTRLATACQSFVSAMAQSLLNGVIVTYPRS